MKLDFTQPERTDEELNAFSEALFVSWPELLKADLAPPGFLVNELIPDTGLVLLYGDPGSCKSWVAFELLRAATTGTPWMENSAPVADGQRIPALLLNYDQSTALVRERLLKVGVPPEARLHFHTFGQPKQTELPVTLRLPEDYKALRMLILHHDIRLVVIDSFRQSHGQNENHSEEMAPVFSALRTLSDEARALILIIHHTNKGGGIRGSGEIDAAMDAEIKATATMKGRGTLEWTKARAWRMDRALFKFEVTEAGKVRFLEPVPGADEVEHHVELVCAELALGALEPAELAARLVGRLNRFQVSAAVRLAKQRGRIVSAKMKGQYSNPARMKLA